MQSVCSADKFFMCLPTTTLLAYLAIMNMQSMCDFNLHFSQGFSHTDVRVGPKDVWESVFKVRRMIPAVLWRNNTAQKKGDMGKRSNNQASTPWPMSFSHASYGIDHASSSHIVPYVPVTGVLECTNRLRPATSRLAFVCWMVVGPQAWGGCCNCLFCLWFVFWY